MPAPTIDPARAAAHALLWQVHSEQRLLLDVMPKVLGPLDPPVRARAQRLALGSLRWADRSDRALGPFLRIKPWPGVHHAMHLALYEVFVEGAAAHGAVNAAVDLARLSERGRGQAGLVNGVLRNVLRQGPEAWEKLPIPRLPKWLRKPLIADFGKPAVAAMEEVFAAAPPLDLTPGDGDGAGWAERLGGRLMPGGSVRIDQPRQVSAMEGFAEGRWWVQDMAAAFPARALGAAPGMRVLDMCAAPGGKTMQLAAAGAQVTALDISERRMQRVAQNLDRCGLSAELVIGDALEHDAEPYDAVLLDAPCTATGTIRRHPDLPHAKTGEDFPDLFALQARMIDKALSLVKPGGRVVFCTCSLLIDEGEEQVRDAMDRHPGLRACPEALDLPGLDPSWIGPEGGARLRPDFAAGIGGMDGFYIVVLQRP
ncbi:RsmB/NOP family class I SAM-dependent RNA methyltransferase [Profundibacterium mesophilum]|uniref:Sun protein n=1 Tax=Profundibacterium mesophilum KAUST100406-0324 TaxID=1037889 RepID=A0A921TDA3_9RHOB|nr:RsmB/NOP family class I SAM-dependent RNA methyltransferase [Profundibacterium mesophilum]KAF0676573.1 Sun protein [Profundibacterium mesophilum KAUST100406-0324]